VDPDPQHWLKRIHELLLSLPEEELAAWSEVVEYTRRNLHSVANSHQYFSANSTKNSNGSTKV
jgi:hypothetical protein